VKPLKKKVGGKNENARRRTMFKTTMISGAMAVALLGAAGAALAAEGAGKSSGPAGEAKADIQKTLGFVPQFFLKFPDSALPGAWEEMKSLQLNPSTALPGKTKELIGLAVASQIPCKYCILAHTEFAKLNGASNEEIGEAVTMAAITRHWSTFLNGTQTDEAQFRAEIAKLVAGAKQAAANHATPPKPGVVTDGQSALRDAAQTLGFAPDFIKRFPDVARGGAWKEMRDVQMNPGTALSAKQKELAGLAVAAQVPCKYCVIAHTEFAKLAGATDGELNEAIAMASLTRNLSTMLNGLQVDEAQFKRDIDRLVKGATAAKKQHTTASR
jgi:AhpD family alkylhydroperoxidase